jgi:hypothetical protein
MKPSDFINEGIAQDAHAMELGHVIDVAREHCFTLAQNAIKLHSALPGLDPALVQGVIQHLSVSCDTVAAVCDQLCNQEHGDQSDQQMPEFNTGVADDFMNGIMEDNVALGKSSPPGMAESTSTDNKIAPLQRKYDTILGQLGMAREQRRARGRHEQGPREMALAARMSAVYSQIAELTHANNSVKSEPDVTEGRTPDDERTDGHYPDDYKPAAPEIYVKGGGQYPGMTVASRGFTRVTDIKDEGDYYFVIVGKNGNGFNLPKDKATKHQIKLKNGMPITAKQAFMMFTGQTSNSQQGMAEGADPTDDEVRTHTNLSARGTVRKVRNRHTKQVRYQACDHNGNISVFDNEASAEKHAGQGMTESEKKQVQDRKTGKWYDPDEAFAKLQKDPEYIAQMKRMGREQGRGWPERKEAGVIGDGVLENSFKTNTGKLPRSQQDKQSAVLAQRLANKKKQNDDQRTASRKVAADKIGNRGMSEATNSYGYKSYSLEQLNKLFRDGTWESQSDPVPGRHVQLRNTRTGAYKTVHVAQPVAETENGAPLITQTGGVAGMPVPRGLDAQGNKVLGMAEDDTGGDAWHGDPGQGGMLNGTGGNLNGLQTESRLTNLRYGVFREGSSLGARDSQQPVRVFDNLAEASACAKHYMKQLTRSQHQYLGLGYGVRKFSESASAGGTAGGAVATGVAQGGQHNKPGTGVPKSVSNRVLPKKIKLGKGIY